MKPSFSANSFIGLTSLSPIAALSFIALCSTPALHAAISLTSAGTTYSQNFDSYAGTEATLPADWVIGAANNGFKGTGTGTSATGGYYAFGTSGDFSLGALRSSSHVYTYSVTFQNNTGATMTGMTLAWDYEQWRFANTSGWNLSATGALAGNTTVDGKDFAGVATGTAGTTTAVPPFTLTGLSIASGATFGFSWATTDATGSDNGVSFDNFSLSNYVSTPVLAQTYWDTNSTAAGVGGDGTWSSSSASFSTTSGGTDPAVRAAVTDPVIFAGTAGTVSVSGTVEADAGITFDTTGYQITGGTALELGGATNTLTTAAPVTATIDTAITGTGGLNKAGDGTLILGNTNTFTGNVGLNAGTLSISSNGNLGDATNDLVFGGGTLATTSSLTLGVDRSVSGSAGTLKVGSGNTLTIDGAVALSGALTLSDTGTVSLTHMAEKTLGSLVFTTSGTLGTTGGGLTVAGNLTATGTSGTATINAPLTLSATNTTVAVANGGTLDLSQDVNLSGSSVSRLITGGPGTLILGGTMTSANSGSGVRIGSSSATPTNGGTVQVSSAGALGAGQLQFNFGTLNATSAISITQGVSMGGREGAAATFAGSDIEVTGTIGLFAASDAKGAHRINVNNNTTFSSAFSTTTSPTTTDGLTIGGTGKLTLAAENASLTKPITLVDTVTLTTTSAGTVAGNVTVATGATLAGSGTVGGNVSIQDGGKLAVGNSPGVMTTGGTTTLESGSIFSWELNTNSDGDTVDAGDTGTRGTNYDGLTSSSLDVASGAIFRVVLTGTADIGNVFWDQDQVWDNLFSAGSITQAVSGQLFNAFEVYNGTSNVTGASAPEGSFSFNGNSLAWTAVPEPSSALAGLLITAGLLRRRRVA